MAPAGAPVAGVIAVERRDTPLTVQARLSTEVARGACAAFLGLLALYLVDHEYFRDLGTPFAYRGDGLSHAMLIKSLIDNFWYLDNPYLGAPFGQEFYDYPIPDAAFLLTLKVLGVLIGNAAVVFNLFFLSGFALIPFVAFLALRQLGVTTPLAVGGAVTYAFLPFHFARLGHLFLSMYVVVPVLVVVAMKAFEGWPFLGRETNAPSLKRPPARTLIGLVLCGLCGAYYAVFGSLLIAVAGAASALRHRSWRWLVNAGLVGAIVLGATAIAAGPSMLYRFKHGTNTSVAARLPADSEVYGLRITQMLLPSDAHRIPQLARIAKAYNQNAPLVNENGTSALGALMSVGFLLLLGVAVFNLARTAESVIGRLATLNIAAVLFATMGGFGAVLAWFGTSQIRAWNRISVFVAFLSLAGLLLIIQKIRSLSSRPPMVWLASAALTSLAVLDETNPSIARSVSARESYWNDRAYIRDLERQFTCRLVYQLPYEEWPEPARRLDPYGQGKPYLQSSEIRWSYGAMKGREGDLWHRTLSRLPIDAQLKWVRGAGFCGVLVNRLVNPEWAATFEPAIRNASSAPPFVSADGHWIFYPVTPTGSAPAPLAAIAGSGFSMDAADALVYTQVGVKVTGQGVSSTGAPGALIFGPYLPMKRGRYQVRVYGRGEPGPPATIDAAVRSGTVILGKASFSPAQPASSDGALATLDFEAPEDVGDLEIRVFVPVGARLTITGYDVVAKADGTR
jgi:phosphoglycerol transferase